MARALVPTRLRALRDVPSGAESERGSARRRRRGAVAPPRRRRDAAAATSPTPHSSGRSRPRRQRVPRGLHERPRANASDLAQRPAGRGAGRGPRRGAGAVHRRPRHDRGGRSARPCLWQRGFDAASPRRRRDLAATRPRPRRDPAATSPRPGRDLAATRPRPRRDVAASAAVAQPCPQSQATFLNNTRSKAHPHGTYRTVSPTELDGMLKMARGLDAGFLGGTYAAAAQRIGCNTTRAARRRFV